MTGSIDRYKIKGSSKPHWRYRVYKGKNDAGVKQYVTCAGFKTQGEAAEAMRARIRELGGQGRKSLVPVETFGQHMRQWLDHHAPQRCTPKTLERYAALAALLLKDSTGEESNLAKTLLTDVTAAQLESVLYDLLKRPATRRKHLSAKTVRHVAGVASVALNRAFRLGLINANPILRVELPRVEKRDARSLTIAEIDALLNACLDDWTHPFIQVSLATGCRRGELLALEWSDIDPVCGVVVVSKSVEQTKQGLRVKKPKSGRSRSFRLPQSAVVALRFQQERQNEHRRMFGADYDNLNLVFALPDGSFFDPALVSQTIVRRMRKAGIMGASLHTLRHTHASGLLSAHVPLPVVSARLGHASTNITASVYAHAMPADDQQAADKWDELITRKVQ